MLGETSAGVDGKWTLGVPALTAGSHTLVVEATGADGVSVTSAPLTVTVAPAAIAPGIDVPAGELALTAGTPGAALTGTAAPGAKVQIFDGDTLLGETTAGPDGKWQFSLPALAAGSHSLLPRVTNSRRCDCRRRAAELAGCAVRLRRASTCRRVGWR